jgi:cytochrome c biogenesis protein
MYHSRWFILLLYLLTLNLVACTFKRWPRDWKIFTEPTLVMDENMEKSISLVRHCKTLGSSAAIRDKMESFLRREFAAPVVTESEGKTYLFAQKSMYSRLGVYVLHLSIIIVFMGAMVGSYFGYNKAFVNLEEGQETSVAYNSSISKNRMETTEQLASHTINLGFTVRCEKFTVSFYDNGMPKEFKSILTIKDNGKTVIDKRPVIVNSPLTYKGITFYQSGYSPAPVFHFTARNRKDGTESKINAKLGEQTSLSDGSSIMVLGYTEDISSVIPQFSGPGVKLVVIPRSGTPKESFLLRNYPKFGEGSGGELFFTYDGAEEKWSTGLQVTKDPGVWIVWLGCALMVIGICMAFFLSHRRIWIRVESGRVTIGGATNKNQAAFQLYFDGLAEKLKKM